MGESRKFIDSVGLAWQVWEISRAGDERAAGAGRWLYFFSRGMTRVATEYPRDWRDLSWLALEDLCAHARVLGADRGAAAWPLALSEAR